MKSYVVGGLLSLVFCFPVFAEKVVREVSVKLTKAFAPEGYDTDDSVEIMVVAKLPSSCFKLSAVSTALKSSQEVLVSLKANEFSGTCHTSPSPVPVVVSLGRLSQEGVYRVLDGSSRNELGSFRVKKAPKAGHGTDGVLYPLILDSYLDWRGNSVKLHIAGVFADDCQEIKKITYDTQENVLVVLPEVDHPEGPKCQKGMYPFEKDFEVTAEIPAKAFLLHVRSMHGRSINKLVFPPETRK